MELLEPNLFDGKTELLDLPSELIPQYALSLNLGQIFHLCLTSKEFNQAICANEHFWKMKFTHDYHFTPEYTGSWKKLYQNYNSLWIFGDNGYGQLGLGDQEDRSTPALVPQLKTKAVSAGGDHTVLIDLEDNVWSFGWNYHGQLGLGNEQRRLTPTLILNPGSSTGSREPSSAFKAKAVSAGGAHTVLIDLDDNVWTFGRNDSGQLGLGDQRDRSTPTLILKPGSSTGSREPSETQVPFKAKAVSSGGWHTVLIDLEDNVWSFGWNDYGQLGLGDHQRRSTPTQIPQLKAKTVSAGGDHTILIDLEDNVWAFGDNDYGQLGLGDQRTRSIPTLVLKPGSSAGSREPSSAFKAKAISTGGAHTVLIDLEDNVWSFGRNDDGQLGLGDQQDRLTPTLILGPGSSTGSREPSSAFKAKAASGGRYHTILFDLDDNVWSFGYNEYGQLGLGDQHNRSTPTQIPQLKAKAVSAGGWYTVLIAILITS